MTSKKSSPKTISQYIASAPKESQPKLKEMYACIKKVLPKSEEGIKWSMPAFSSKYILVMFAGFKKHIGFYPTPSAIVAFKKDLARYKTAKGSIQFPLDTPLPLPLVRKITKFRLQESIKEDKKWKEKC